ncbi:asparagine synthase-related protein [Terriglobus albidus]|uniref:asparagine synthase-related protein n=1 Tax=Terriglobus albidus TaxID=1592106 RepID=UPI0021DFEE8A|nr:asparagine synthetase B family protein [Terriglobus albidus]
MFALIVDQHKGTTQEEVVRLAVRMRGPASAGPLRTVPPGPSVTRHDAVAAARAPGLLPEDQYDVQPLRSHDGRTLFVCQARLDNREELLPKLDMPKRSGVADSSLLFAAWQRWGEEIHQHLAGDYAFAAYMGETDSVYAAVDHIGHYRLYFVVNDRRLAICSQLAALAQSEEHGGVDEVLLGLSAEARYIQGRTPFRRIHRVEGGSCLRWRNGEVTTSRWWQPSTHATRYLRSEEYVAAAREAFDRAVACCLRSAQPISANLSGGLDSGLVSATAAMLLRAQGKTLKAFTAAPANGVPVFERRGWDADDAACASLTAAMHSNIEHFVIRGDGRIALDLLPEIHATSATPVRNGANHLWMDAIHKTAGEGVMLVGARGNFSISYSGAGANIELLRGGRFLHAWRSARELRQGQGSPIWKTLRAGVLPPAIRQLFPAVNRSDLAVLSLTSNSFQRRYRALIHPRRPTPGTRAAASRSATLPAFPWAADTLAMWGSEWRDPLADKRLLELLLSFPLVAFLQEGRSRGLARALGRRRLPEEIRLRTQRGSQAADYSAAMAVALARYRSLAERMQQSAVCRELFNFQELAGIFDRIGAGNRSPELTAPVDRVMDAGLFLLKQE